MKKNHFVGCATEYRAANYFLEQGIEVFWPAIHQSRFDFLIQLEGKYLRVQVKTAYKRLDTSNYRVKCCNYGDDDFDILVAVHPESWKVWVIETPDAPPNSLGLLDSDAIT